MEITEKVDDRLYPIFLKLGGKPCLVVGGGTIALQKAEAMLSSGACVTVVSPDAVPELITHCNEGRLAMEQRPYSPGEAANYYLVIAATDQPDINQRVYNDAHSKNVLVNVVDVPDQCDFYVPSILSRGRLQIAVSTAGASPRTARHVREFIEAQLPDTYEGLLECFFDLRNELKQLLPDQPQERMRINMMVADSEEACLYLSGNPEPLKELINNALDPYRG